MAPRLPTSDPLLRGPEPAKGTECLSHFLHGTFLHQVHARHLAGPQRDEMLSTPRASPREQQEGHSGTTAAATVPTDPTLQPHPSSLQIQEPMNTNEQHLPGAAWCSILLLIFWVTDF